MATSEQAQELDRVITQAELLTGAADEMQTMGERMVIAGNDLIDRARRMRLKLNPPAPSAKYNSPPAGSELDSRGTPL